MNQQAQDDVQKIVDAYTHTRMTVDQFQGLVEIMIANAEERGAQQGVGGRTYDEGFSEGYDTCLAEHGLAQ